MEKNFYFKALDNKPILLSDILKSTTNQLVSYNLDKKFIPSTLDIAPPLTFWRDNVLNEVYICVAIDGQTALWKKIKLTTDEETLFYTIRFDDSFQITQTVATDNSGLIDYVGGRRIDLDKVSQSSMSFSTDADKVSIKLPSGEFLEQNSVNDYIEISQSGGVVLTRTGNFSYDIFAPSEILTENFIQEIGVDSSESIFPISSKVSILGSEKLTVKKDALNTSVSTIEPNPNYDLVNKWSSDVVYAQNESVLHLGVFYTSLIENNTSSTFILTDWKNISLSITFVLDKDENKIENTAGFVKFTKTTKTGNNELSLDVDDLFITDLFSGLILQRDDNFKSFIETSRDLGLFSEVDGTILKLFTNEKITRVKAKIVNFLGAETQIPFSENQEIIFREIDGTVKLSNPAAFTIGFESINGGGGGGERTWTDENDLTLSKSLGDITQLRGSSIIGFRRIENVDTTFSIGETYFNQNVRAFLLNQGGVQFDEVPFSDLQEIKLRESYGISLISSGVNEITVQNTGVVNILDEDDIIVFKDNFNVKISSFVDSGLSIIGDFEGLKINPQALIRQTGTSLRDLSGSEKLFLFNTPDQIQRIIDSTTVSWDIVNINSQDYLRANTIGEPPILDKTTLQVKTGIISPNEIELEINNRDITIITNDWVGVINGDLFESIPSGSVNVDLDFLHDLNYFIYALTWDSIVGYSIIKIISEEDFSILIDSIVISFYYININFIEEINVNVSKNNNTDSTLLSLYKIDLYNITSFLTLEENTLISFKLKSTHSYLKNIELIEKNNVPVFLTFFDNFAKSFIEINFNDILISESEWISSIILYSPNNDTTIEMFFGFTGFSNGSDALEDTLFFFKTNKIILSSLIPIGYILYEKIDNILERVDIQECNEKGLPLIKNVIEADFGVTTWV